MIKRFSKFNNNRIIEKYKYQLLNIIYESTDTCPVDESRNYKRKKLKKAFGERNADSILNLPITKYPIDEVIKYLKNKLPIKSTMADIITNLGIYLNDDFLKSKKIEADNVKVNYTLEQLLKKVNYTVDVVDNVDEAIEKYEKYYKPDELICTLNSNSRFLESYVTFFKHNDINTTYHANDLTQNNLNDLWKSYLEKKGRKNNDGSYNLDNLEPSPNDPYSTSLLSVQISKISRTLKSISRYNHTIDSADFVYSNLDDIIDGLHSKFYSYFNVPLKRQDKLPKGYVMDSQDRIFKYQNEVNGNYFGDGFIIKSNGETILINKDYQLMIDGTLYNINNPSSFVVFGNLLGIGEVTKIIPKGNNQYLINVDYLNDSYTALITVVDSQLTEFKSDDIKVVGDNFLDYSISLTSMSLINVEKIGYNILYYNRVLKSIDLPNVEKIDDRFLRKNNTLTSINLPNVKEIGDSFLPSNESSVSIDLPNVEKIGNNFLTNNKSLTSIDLHNVKEIGDSFLANNNSLTSISLPNVREIGNSFLANNNSLTNIDLPNVKEIGYTFLYNNEALPSISLPNVEKIGDRFLNKNKNINKNEILNNEAS